MAGPSLRSPAMRCLRVTPSGLVPRIRAVASINVHSVATYVGVATEIVISIVIVEIRVIPVVVAAIVSAMPSGIPVVSPTVVDHGSSMPIAIPATPSPTAAPAPTHHGANRHSRSEGKQASGHQVSRAVPRRRVWRPINHRRVVGRYVNYLRARRLDNDNLLPTLTLSCHRLLGRGFQIARGLRLLAQKLNSFHHFRLLIVIRLSQLRRPREILGQVVEHSG